MRAIPNTVEILITGKNLTKPEFDAAVRDARNMGTRAGQDLSKGMGDELKRDLPKDIEKPLEDSGRRGGQSAGKAAAGGISPLIIGAFAAAATVGPAAVLGATALAVVGAGALITKGNQQLQESYAQLGQRASAAVQQAAAPLIPELYASVQVLEQGVAKVGPELKSVFAAVAPDVTAITGGLVSLVSNTLPGVASGLRAIAPFAQQLGADFGKIGTGLGGFFAALGSGASGGMAGLNALVDVVQALLPDIGKIVASLSNGLGPALHDIANVAIPTANALAAFVGAIPPHAIEGAAVATAALFAAFKVGSLLGLVTSGKTFLEFLGATVTAERAAALAADEAAASTKGLAAALDIVMGPIGILTVATAGLYAAISTTDKGTQGWDSTAVKAIGTAVQQKAAMDASAQATAAQATAVAEANNSLATNQQLLTQSAVKAGQNAVAALSFASAQGGLNEKLASTIADFNLAKGASSAYQEALDALYGKYQKYSDAQATFTTDLEAAKTGLKGGKDAFDLNTAAGSANEQILSTLVTANANRAAALLTETGNQQLANQALQAGAIQIDNMARSAHFTQGQIDALNLALYGTKNIGSIQVPISADTHLLYDAVGRALRWVDNQVAYVQVGASGTTVGGHQLLAHGGIVGAAATGGPRSNLTWVGENGPELLPLPPGTQVHSNPDSMRMAAEAAGSRGGWDGVVRLEVTGDDLIAQWIRNHVRVVAGNATNSVQRAFGQTF